MSLALYQGIAHRESLISYAIDEDLHKIMFSIFHGFCFKSGQSPCDGSALSANSGNIQIPSNR